MSKCLIVFSKYYDDVSSKTRLRASMNSKIVDEFNRNCFEVIKEKTVMYDTLWSIQSKGSTKHVDYKNLNVYFQKKHNLGDIIVESLLVLRDQYERIGILGTDTPHLDESIFENDFEYYLSKSDDGGFYYFGFPSSIDLSIFSNIRYSTGFTSDDLASRLESAGVNLKYGEDLFDIDIEKDLYRLKEFYEGKKINLESEKKLVSFLEGKI